MESTLKFLRSKGLSRRGDEDTEAYSDDEGEKDTDATRRERKEAVQLTRARAKSISEKIPKNRQFREGSVRKEVNLDTSEKNSTRYSIPVDGITSFSDSSVTAARELDRETHTAMRQVTVNQRTQSGIDQRVQQTFITFDPKPLLEAWVYAKGYPMYLVLGSVTFCLSLYMGWGFYSQIRNYV